MSMLLAPDRSVAAAQAADGAATKAEQPAGEASQSE